MVGKATDRKGRDAKSEKTDTTETIAPFTLPDSLPCSEIEFPVLIKRTNVASWKQILEESETTMKEIEEFVDKKEKSIPKSPFLKTECDYIKDEVFKLLLPALEVTLIKAKIWGALRNPKCFFNGIDHIAQFLWTNNPKYPSRKWMNLHLFNMPWVRQHLKEHPRPQYPKSWLWPEEYAAIVIQRTVRRYFVQRLDEVQEMREFWKKIKTEEGLPEINTNPLLAKRFASSKDYNQKT